MDSLQLKTAFATAFGSNRTPLIARAPGRVNLIGEHTDYNQGFVFPMAIDSEIRLVFAPRNDGRVRLMSREYPDQVAEFSVRSEVTRGRMVWANYSRGVCAKLAEEDVPLTGFDGLLVNTLPRGGGLSSSAALEAVTAIAQLHMARRTLDLKTLVKVCQKAEHEFANVPCGIMDQTIVLGAKAGNAMLLDCRSFSTRFVPISPAIRIVIVNTEVAHTLASGEYARRRQQCEAALEAIVKIEPSVKSLRDVDESLLERSKSSMDDLHFRRARHVITENRRTVEAADCLEKGDFAAVGKLMLQSHQSLREDYEVSCPELDTLVEASVGLRGVMGARMTGGGFGGCIVALVEAPAAAAYQKAVAEAFASRYSRVPPTIVTSAAAGAAMISTQEPKHL